MRSHGWYDLPPFSYDEDARTLTTRLPSGAVTFRARDGALEASGRGIPRAELAGAARRVFSLDLDLSACSGVFAGEPALLRGLARGGGRMLRAPSLFEDAVKMLLTTNCSWAATRGMVVRLIDLAGDGSGGVSDAGGDRAPPARAPEEPCPLRLSGGGALTLREARGLGPARSLGLGAAGGDRPRTCARRSWPSTASDRTPRRACSASSAGTTTWPSTRGFGSGIARLYPRPREDRGSRDRAPLRAVRRSIGGWRCGWR